MRVCASFAAAGLLTLAACTPLGETAGTRPSPTPAQLASPSPSPPPSPSPIPTPEPSPSPVPSPPPSLWVQINQDDYGFVTAQTVAGASCNLRVTLPTGMDAPGLRNPVTADAGGNVQWRYPNPDNDPGNGVNIVTCSLNGLSGTASAYYTEGN